MCRNNSYLLSCFILTMLLVRETLCQNEAPTYDLLMTFTCDRPLMPHNNSTMFLAAYAKAGLSEEQVIAHGREGTDWFLEKYGVDFTNIDPSFYTEGVITGYNNTVLFMSYLGMAPAERPYRLVSAINHTTSALFTYAPVGDQGWMVLFTEDFQSTGLFNLTIPAQSTVLYADYLIDVSLDDMEQLDPFFPPESFEGDVVRIKFQTAEVFFPAPTEPSGRQPLQILDFDVWNAHYGTGRAQGVINAITGDIRNVFRFPENVL